MIGRNGNGAWPAPHGREEEEGGGANIVWGRIALFECDESESGLIKSIVD